MLEDPAEADDRWEGGRVRRRSCADRTDKIRPLALSLPAVPAVLAAASDPTRPPAARSPGSGLRAQGEGWLPEGQGEESGIGQKGKLSCEPAPTKDLVTHPGELGVGLAFQRCLSGRTGWVSHPCEISQWTQLAPHTRTGPWGRCISATAAVPKKRLSAGCPLRARGGKSSFSRGIRAAQPRPTVPSHPRQRGPAMTSSRRSVLVDVWQAEPRPCALPPDAGGLQW